MQFVEGRTLAQLVAALHQPPAAPATPANGDVTSPYSPAAADALTPPVAALSTERGGPKGRDYYRTVAQLLAQAADALEHAHSLGIVHRDVKPGNLLVDAAGKLWVADFGLARLGPDAGLTMSGDLLGTLRYMAPEQALSHHGLVDHRADVYALGATLYELLTGKPAVDAAERAEILRKIAFEEPTAPRKRDKAIPAELETIALKCLAKNPAERYATAGELADDLRRWLDDKPIKARRPTVRQRLARWARRHPGLAAALGLAAGLLLAGAWAWDRETRHAEAAARTVAAEADQLRNTDRLPEALAVARRAADLLPRFGGDAALRREIAERVADLQLLNRLDEARLERAADRGDGAGFDNERMASQFRQAFLDYGADVLGGEEPAVVEALRRPAVAAQIAGALSEWERITTDPAVKERIGRLAEALDADPRQLVSRVRQAEAAKDVEALRRLAAEAQADLPPPAFLMRLAKALEAVSSLPEVERLLRAGHQRYPADICVIFELGFTLTQMGPSQAAEAVGFFRTAQALRPSSVGVGVNLASALNGAGRDEESAAAYRRVIALSPNSALAHYNLGNVLGKLSRDADQEAEYRSAIALKPDHGEAHCNLGATLCMRGRIAEAEAECRTAMALKPDFAEAHVSLALVFLAQGRKAEAQQECRRAMDLKPSYAEGYNQIGNTCHDLGHPADAESYYRQAFKMNPGDAGYLYNVANSLKAQGKLAEAEAAYQEVIALRPTFAEARCNLGNMLVTQGRYSEGAAQLRIGHDQGSKRKNWPYPSAQWVRDAERMAALAPRLPSLLAGEAQPADATERVTLAQICQRHKKRYAAAAGFYAAAFAAEPKLAEDLQAARRYSAACAAALAGCGQGKDAAELDDAERARLRRQALDWLTADLAVWAKVADNTADRPRLRQKMQHWQQDSDFAGVRDAAALAKLPEAERAAWQKLWADVADLLKRTGPN
jgi:Tfp pilus assembly protein PilF